jgi:hypothetical protein
LNLKKIALKRRDKKNPKKKKDSTPVKNAAKRRIEKMTGY